jgi:hypothetical protein
VVSDIAGCMDPEYVWHDMAQVWQTAGAGEKAVADMSATPLEQRAAMFESFGLSNSVARRVAAGADATMGRCILALYRSAAQPAMANWGRDLAKAAARPGLVIIPTEDHFTGGEKLARRSAERAGAEAAVLDGLGHWWMCQDPARGAGVLNAFLAKLVTRSARLRHEALGLLDVAVLEALHLLPQVLTRLGIDEAQVLLVDQRGLMRLPFEPGLLRDVLVDVLAEFAGQRWALEPGKFLLILAAEDRAAHGSLRMIRRALGRRSTFSSR